MTNETTPEPPNTYDPWGVVMLVMTALSREGLRPRMSGMGISEAKDATEALLIALEVLPVVPDYAALDAAEKLTDES